MVGQSEASMGKNTVVSMDEKWVDATAMMKVQIEVVEKEEQMVVAKVVY